MPGGGGGNGPRCCAAMGNASAPHATIKNALTPMLLSTFTAIPKMTLLILSTLLTLMQSLLYLKIRCIEHEFRSPHLTTFLASWLDELCLRVRSGTAFGILNNDSNFYVAVSNAIGPPFPSSMKLRIRTSRTFPHDDGLKARAPLSRHVIDTTSKLTQFDEVREWQL